MFNLTFLNSGILFALSAVILPIIIYFFAKKKPQKVVFSSLKFIKNSFQKQNRKINLVDILLLIIRILIILLIIFGIARPAMKLPFLKSESGHPQTAVSIILDNSYSMNYLSGTKTNLDIGKDIILQIDKMLTNDDKWILFSRNSSWNDWNSVIKSGNISKELLQNIELTPQALSLQTLVLEAIKKIESTQIINKEIYIISDLQKEEIDVETDIPIFIIPTRNPQKYQNVSCQNTKYSRKLFDGNGGINTIETEIVNNSHYQMEDVIYQLFIDGQPIAERVTQLKKGERKQISFNINDMDSGWHKGFMMVKDERLLYDNKNYFSFYIPDIRRVGIISDGSLPLPIQSMLDIFLKENDEAIYLDSQESSIEEVNNFDFLLLYNFSKLNPRLDFILENIEIPKIVVMHQNNNDLKYLQNRFNIALEKYVIKDLQIDEFNKFHPVTSIFTKKNLPLINNFWNIKSLQNDKSLIKAGNLPILIFAENDFLLNTDIGKLDNEIITNSFYPILMFRLFQHISDKNFGLESLRIGDFISSKSNKIIDPNGKTRIASSNVIADEIGNYEIVGESIVSVNLNYSESDFRILKSDNIVEKDWQQKILVTRYGIELWKYLFITVLILFILEMIIVKIIERKSR
ncbi:MAG: BatA domain-containing protein [Candidatus Cloacimonadota bacterium]|nr:BatA domain-containing protein [Candidatus Cloacimonadota bacterium]